jgi:xylulokinase
MKRRVVLGVDSGTQSTKVVAVDLDTMAISGEGRAPHSGGTTQHPHDWWDALVLAVRATVTPEMEVAGIAVGGQQHGLVTMDGAGAIVRPASLWNNIDAAPDAERLNDLADFAGEVGSRLVASFTIAKLAHLARTDPDAMARTASVCLPHDWLTYRLTGNLVTDRGDASGSGWWSPATGEVRRDLLALGIGSAKAEALRVPAVLGADEPAGELTPTAAEALGLPTGIPVGPGTGDNMAAALGIGATEAELVISLGTSGTAYAVSNHPTRDPSGAVCGFADATGRFLPLACMINCTRVVDITARLFGIDPRTTLDRLEGIDPGAGGLLMLPYLGGERTPNLPNATGSLFGLAESNAAPELIVRAALDGVAAGLAYCQEALVELGVRKEMVTLVGGGSTHPTWQQAIADATGLPVTVLAGGEHAARGAAIQAAAVATGRLVARVAESSRPPILAERAPRPELRAAFRLDERRAQIANQTVRQ